MKKLGLSLAVVVFAALHQDVWLWRGARPLVFGFLPVGLSYHRLYTVGCSLLLALLVATAWPKDLEREAEADERPRDERRSPPSSSSSTWPRSSTSACSRSAARGRGP